MNVPSALGRLEAMWFAGHPVAYIAQKLGVSVGAVCTILRRAKLARKTVAAWSAHDWYAKVLGPLAFDYPCRTIPLQGADLAAHQMNWDVEARSQLSPEGQTKNLALATGGRYTHGNWFDRNGLLTTMKRYRETGQDLVSKGARCHG